MPEVIFPGPEGRLEGRYHPQKDRDAPIAIVLHPHPQFGGTMNNKVVYNLHYAFYNMGFTVLRFNFRGVGRSQGEYDQGVGELSDAASALDYLQSMNNNSKHCWVAGFSFGAWIGMQLLMRRPGITGFASASPPARNSRQSPPISDSGDVPTNSSSLPARWARALDHGHRSGSPTSPARTGLSST